MRNQPFFGNPKRTKAGKKSEHKPLAEFIKTSAFFLCSFFHENIFVFAREGGPFVFAPATRGPESTAATHPVTLGRTIIIIYSLSLPCRTWQSSFWDRCVLMKEYTPERCEGDSYLATMNFCEVVCHGVAVSTCGFYESCGANLPLLSWQPIFFFHARPCIHAS